MLLCACSNSGVSPPGGSRTEGGDLDGVPVPAPEAALGRSPWRPRGLSALALSPSPSCLTAPPHLTVYPSPSQPPPLPPPRPSTGEIGDVYIPRDHNSGDNRGFAFVRYHEKEDAERALEKVDGTDFKGRDLRVSVATRKRPDHFRDGGGGHRGGGRGGGRYG